MNALKPHVIAICTSMFFLCWLLLGVRAGFIAPCCFLAGMWVSQKEEAVARYIDRLKARVEGLFRA